MILIQIPWTEWAMFRDPWDVESPNYLRSLGPSPVSGNDHFFNDSILISLDYSPTNIFWKKNLMKTSILSGFLNLEKHTFLCWTPVEPQTKNSMCRFLLCLSYIIQSLQVIKCCYSLKTFWCFLTCGFTTPIILVMDDHYLLSIETHDDDWESPMT